tara:strand:- start:262 stop:450 length:189 start_codon:yes stop_codon:yes gene_type:complete
MKKKKTFIAIATFNSEFWSLIKDREAIIYKVKFYNGEHHFYGLWSDNNSEFILPSIFFDEKN